MRGGTEDGQRDQSQCFEASATNFEGLVDEFDRADVVAAVPEHPAERVVEVVDALRRRPRLSAMIHLSSNAISVMKPRVLRLAVFASWTLSGSSAEKVSAGRPSARSSASIASTR